MFAMQSLKRLIHPNSSYYQFSLSKLSISSSQRCQQPILLFDTLSNTQSTVLFNIPQYTIYRQKIPSRPYSTILKNEVDKFSHLSQSWWDLDGSAKLLHKMNGIRVSYLRECLHAEIPLEKRNHLPVDKPFQGLRVLDVGCGGGILSQSLARLGATVVAIDASKENIETCQAHSFGHGSPFQEDHLTFLLSSPEQMVTDHKEAFDVVCSLEVIEHVAQVEFFLHSLVQLVKPGGHIFLSTINRTPTSFLLTKLVAEYMCQWVPIGTHNWQKYITPVELIALLRRELCYILNITGLDYDPYEEKWSLNRHNVSCNYMLHASKPSIL